MLVVMAVIAVLATPDFHRSMPGLEQRSAAGRLAAAMRDARGHAVRTNQEIVVSIDVQGRAYAASHRPDWQKLEGDFAVSLFTAAIETVDDRIGGIRFFPDGTSTGGKVSLASDRRHYAVVVDWLTGRVDIVE